MEPAGQAGIYVVMGKFKYDSLLGKVRENDGYTYEHFQSSPSTTWVVNHKLGKIPIVHVIDGLGNETLTAIRHLDTNTLQVLSNVAFTGRAYCS